MCDLFMNDFVGDFFQIPKSGDVEVAEVELAEFIDYCRVEFDDIPWGFYIVCEKECAYK